MNSPNDDVRIRSGGLMRCCLMSIEQFIDSKQTGNTHRCKYCQNPMRKDADGAWEWDGEKCLREEGT